MKHHKGYQLTFVEGKLFSQLSHIQENHSNVSFFSFFLENYIGLTQIIVVHRLSVGHYQALKVQKH